MTSGRIDSEDSNTNFLSALTKEVVLLLDHDSKSEVTVKKPEKLLTDTQTIQESAALARSKNNFCTIDGLFCVPANYSK